MSNLIHTDKNTVDQSGATADGDNVGRDKITLNEVTFHERQTQIEGWLDKLAAERESDPKAQMIVDSLQYYLERFPFDDIVGLEAKLKHAGRSEQTRIALRKKEAFSKLLDYWQAYPSAQEIIAYFLAKIDTVFENEITPMLGISANHEIDAAIKAKLVEPILKEMGCGPFMLNYNHVYGMVYWLAEQCFIRWHK